MLKRLLSSTSALFAGLGPQKRASSISDLEKYLIAKSQGGSIIDLPSINGAISENTATSITTWLAGVKLIGEDVGKCSRKLYLRETREELPKHPIARVLRQPNPWMTRIEFFTAMVAAAVNHGNAYALLEYDSRRNVIAMWPIAPWRITADLVDGQMVYRYTHPQRGVQEFINPENIWHLKGFSFDGINGISVIRECADTFALAKVEELYAKYFFENNARGDIYYQHPGVISKEAQGRFLEAMESRHRGVANAHRAAILEEGMQVKNLSMNVKDVMLIEAQELSDTRLLSLLRIPPHKLGFLKRATNNNIEHQEIEYVSGAIEPWGARVEESLMRCLMGPGERDDMIIEHVYDSLLKTDVKSRNEAFKALWEIGVLSPNDIRRKINERPREGGDGYYVPLNMADSTNPPPADPPKKAKVAA